MVNYIRCQLLFRKLTVRYIIILNNHSNAKLKLSDLENTSHQAADHIENILENRDFHRSVFGVTCF